MTWGTLLIVTLIMLVLDGAAISRSVLVAILVAAMAVKAVLIAGNFMHLRHERSGLVLTVVLGLFAMGLILYGLIAPDAKRIHDMMAGR
jgi:cytochrome c oxidase subunit IV